jgi:DNA polymerase
MLEPRRQAYLQALGIETYVLRNRDSGLGTRDSVMAHPVARSLDAAQRNPGHASEEAVELAIDQTMGQKTVGAGPGPSPDQSPAPDWSTLRQQVAACQLCPELVRQRSQTVFGVGNTQADWLIIGEAPGADEDRQGEPFVGRAGQLLNAMLQAMGLRREAVYIANILKCRPPGNRDPQADEAHNCRPYLLRQIELIQPRMLLALGRIAAQNLLQTDLALGELRGRVHPYGERGIPLVVTYHPAYLLRYPEFKAKTWADLQLALRSLPNGHGAGSTTPE